MSNANANTNANGDVAAVVKRFRDLWNEGAWDQLDSCLAPGYVHHVGLWTVGIKEYKEMSLKVRGSMPDYRIGTEDVTVTGDRVATRWTGRGTHTRSYGGEKPTGKTIVIPGMQFYRIVDGKIAEDWESIDNLSILQQIGVLPQNLFG